MNTVSRQPPNREGNVELIRGPPSLPRQFSETDTFRLFGLDFTSALKHLYSRYRISHNNEYSQSHSTPPGQPGIDALSLSGQSTPSVMTAGAHERIYFISGYPCFGYISPAIQNQNVGMELWRRHLGSVLSPFTTQFEDTRLPSATCNILQLRIWSIGSRGDGIVNTQTSIDMLRRDAASQMDKYRERLSENSEWQAGDSIVRGYEIHDHKYFTIEQLITIHIYVSRNNGNRNGKGTNWQGKQVETESPLLKVADSAKGLFFQIAVETFVAARRVPGSGTISRVMRHTTHISCPFQNTAYGWNHAIRPPGSPDRPPGTAHR